MTPDTQSPVRTAEADAKAPQPIDWSKPIEAIHGVLGAFRARLIGMLTLHGEGVRYAYAVELPFGVVQFDVGGKALDGSLRLRNISPPPAESSPAVPAFVPTAHKPHPDVECWSVTRYADDEIQPYVRVDGKWEDAEDHAVMTRHRINLLPTRRLRHAATDIDWDARVAKVRAERAAKSAPASPPAAPSPAETPAVVDGDECGTCNHGTAQHARTAGGWLGKCNAPGCTCGQYEVSVGRPAQAERPEQRLPYTAETWPHEAKWLSNETLGIVQSRVRGVRRGGVAVFNDGTTVSWSVLASDWKWSQNSFDSGTPWRPCLWHPCTRPLARVATDEPTASKGGQGNGA